MPAREHAVRTLRSYISTQNLQLLLTFSQTALLGLIRSASVWLCNAVMVSMKVLVFDLTIDTVRITRTSVVTS